MKRLLLVFTIFTVALQSCIKVDIDDSTNNNGGGETGTGTKQEQIIASKIITGVVQEDVTLPKGRYTLKGYVYVTNRATLTIAPGSIIVGDVVDKGALIIERQAQLIAEGTADQPIVFTSGKAPGQRNPGDWGGIVLLGRAPTNRTTEPLIEGGINANYGGNVPTDKSGVLKYVRIEFAGIASQPNSEINGLTCGGVGNGTVLENIQVSFGNDDAYEFFGGNVNAKRLIAFGTADDDFDFDFGYTGNIQFGVSLRKPDFADAGDDVNGIECDNDADGSSLTPFTKPVLSNFTFIGNNGPHPTAAARNTRGNRFRRATRFMLGNSILMATQNAGLFLDGAATVQAYVNGESIFKNNLVHSITNPYVSNADAILTSAALKAKAESEGCITYANLADIKLTSPMYSTAPNFLPATGSPALAGGEFSWVPSTNTFFDKTVTYRGAFGTTNWTTGWTNWDPQNADYSAVK